MFCVCINLSEGENQKTKTMSSCEGEDSGLSFEEMMAAKITTLEKFVVDQHKDLKQSFQILENSINEKMMGQIEALKLELATFKARIEAQEREMEALRKELEEMRSNMEKTRSEAPLKRPGSRPELSTVQKKTLQRGCGQDTGALLAK